MLSLLEISSNAHSHADLLQSVAVPIDDLVKTLDEIDVAKDSSKSDFRFVGHKRINDDHWQRSALFPSFSRDFCELHLCHRVEVRHRKTNNDAKISLIQGSHSTRPNAA